MKTYVDDLRHSTVHFLLESSHQLVQSAVITPVLEDDFHSMLEVVFGWTAHFVGYPMVCHTIATLEKKARYQFE